MNLVYAPAAVAGLAAVILGAASGSWLPAALAAGGWAGIAVSAVARRHLDRARS